MLATYADHRLMSFSFHHDPVLVIENFWTADERTYFQKAMAATAWRSLAEMPSLRAVFPGCGDWLKAEMGPDQARIFLNKLTLPCINDYIESFPNIRRRHMSFSYYCYRAGDCLLTHDDTVQGYDPVGTKQTPPLLRRIALVTYLHDEWHSDWGGELIIYSSNGDDTKKGGHNGKHLSITHCIEPRPGSLVPFTVPRFHRVSRIDPISGNHRRLSIAGWFMTEHENADSGS